MAHVACTMLLWDELRSSSPLLQPPGSLIRQINEIMNAQEKTQAIRSAIPSTSIYANKPGGANIRCCQSTTNMTSLGTSMSRTDWRVTQEFFLPTLHPSKRIRFIPIITPPANALYPNSESRRVSNMQGRLWLVGHPTVENSCILLLLTSQLLSCEELISQPWNTMSGERCRPNPSCAVCYLPPLPFTKRSTTFIKPGTTKRALAVA